MPSKLKEKKASASKAAPAKTQGRKKAPAPPTKLHKRAESSSDESADEGDELHGEDGVASGSEEDEDWEDVSEDEEEGSSEDEEDVDEEGMSRLMKALGEDGLDEFAQEQLRALQEDEDDEEDDEQAGDASSGDEEDVGAEDQEGSSEDDEAEDEQGEEVNEAGPSTDLAVAVDELSDEEMLDADVMPRQKVEIDNKVRSISLARVLRFLMTVHSRSPWSAYGQP